MATITFKSEKDLEAFVSRIAKREAALAVNHKTAFRSKKDTSTPQSSYEARSYRGNPNSGVSSIASGGVTVTGSRGVTIDSQHATVAALTSLLDVLAGLNIIIDDSTS